jgi:hypothetical protein
MILRAAIIACLLCAVVAADDATEIVKESAQHDQINWEQAHNYTFQERDQETKGGRKETRTLETVILYGEPFQRLIAKDDKPLDEHDRNKEQAKFDKEVDKRKRESESGRLQQIDEKDRKKRQELRDEIVRAFNFQLTGDETVDGHDTWVIAAEPRAGYQPHSEEGKFLQAIRGKLWIDKVDYEWVRVEADVIHPAHFGLFLLTLSPGTTLHFEQARINDEVWLPKRVVVRVDGRLVFKHMKDEVVADYSDYHRFQTDTKITGVSEPLP